jgi:Cu(I)/Ag(I) efflux system protein CusF
VRAHLLALATILALTAAETATAQPAAKPMSDMKGMSSAPASATKTGKGTGVITEIDAKDATLTIKHGPIASLGWPAMTMSFRAVPPALLTGLKVGQKIAFDTNPGNGLPEVTAIRKP